MSRQKPSLRAPGAAEDLAGFPRFRLRPSHALWRVVRDDGGPWWYSSSLDGRFDLPRPDGTCYLASDDLGALIEILGPGLRPGGLAPASLLHGRHLRILSVPEPHALADALSRKATRWVTAELSTITPYALPQAWARALRSASLDGIRYALRHSTSRRHHAFALFGPAGERPWRTGRRVRISDEHRRRLAGAFGILLFDRPASDELVFAADPAPRAGSRGA